MVGCSWKEDKFNMGGGRAHGPLPNHKLIWCGKHFKHKRSKWFPRMEPQSESYSYTYGYGYSIMLVLYHCRRVSYDLVFQLSCSDRSLFNLSYSPYLEPSKLAVLAVGFLGCERGGNPLSWNTSAAWFFVIMEGGAMGGAMGRAVWGASSCIVDGKGEEVEVAAMTWRGDWYTWWIVVCECCTYSTS